MKIAISGKGGVGKSTVAAALALLAAARGERVLAVDADPDANLAAALGMDAATRAKIVPIAQQIDLIEERAGVQLNEYGKIFSLNPEVSDIAEKLAVNWRGVDLLVLGAIQGGGSGCACPASTFLRALVTDLVLYKNETLIMDFEAGIEHLGRATAYGIDAMIIVAEPGQRSVDCAEAVIRMSKEIGIKKFLVVANKITSPEDEEYLKNAFNTLGVKVAACIPYSDDIRAADRNGLCALDVVDDEMKARFAQLIDVIIS